MNHLSNPKIISSIFPEDTFILKKIINIFSTSFHFERYYKKYDMAKPKITPESKVKMLSLLFEHFYAHFICLYRETLCLLNVKWLLDSTSTHVSTQIWYTALYFILSSWKFCWLILNSLRCIRVPMLILVQ